MIRTIIAANLGCIYSKSASNHRADRTLGLETWHGIGHVDGKSPLKREVALGHMSAGSPAEAAGASEGSAAAAGGEPRANATQSTGDLDQLRSDLDTCEYSSGRLGL